LKDPSWICRSAANRKVQAARQDHATAIVEPGAKLGAGCEIHAYRSSSATPCSASAWVHPFAVVGGDPQYLNSTRPLATEVRVGAGTVIRETSRSIARHAGGFTSIVENCFSDGELPCRARLRARRPGDSANNAMLGGHVEAARTRLSAAARASINTVASARA